MDKIGQNGQKWKHWTNGKFRQNGKIGQMTKKIKNREPHSL